MKAQSSFLPSLPDEKCEEIEMRAVDVLIPVYKPGEEFGRLLERLEKQKYPVHRLIVMNTEEEYWDSKWEKSTIPMTLVHLSKAEFDHGGTRKQAAELSAAEILIYMTQDALPADRNLISNLVRALEQNEKIAAAYARQLPKKNCGFLERFTRSFNYPETSAVRWKEDLLQYGIKTFFCSNVCAAYKKHVFQELGGFPDRAIFNEDMVYAGNLIQNGYGIAYAADARVYHSHNYSPIQQFHRNFDLGVSQAEHPEIFAAVSSEGEGLSLVRKSLRHLHQNRRWDLIPMLLLQSACKYAGYLAGKHYKKLPKKWILKFTMLPEYWM